MQQKHIKNIGIFWYTDAEQYAQYLEIFEDANGLPESFPQWRKKALKLLEKLKREGYATMKIYSTPQEFQTWCIANNAALNGQSRSQFASFKAESGAPMHVSLHNTIHRANQCN
jgi:hypothetical protein